MTATAPLGALLGFVAAVGLSMAVLRMPPLRQPRLVDRLEPYLRVPGGFMTAPAPGRTLSPFPAFDHLVRPWLERGAALLGRVLGGAATTRVRLQRAGRRQSVEAFRLEQLLWGVAGVGLGLGASLLMLLNGSSGSLLTLAVVAGAGGVTGVLACDQRLSRAVRDRESRMLAELPTVADLLALAVAAGETPAGALERVASRVSGSLAEELQEAMDDVRVGVPLVNALDAMAERTGLTPLARFVDGVAVAVERGTPLADVLRSQAGDVRDARRRALLDIGGRKEIAMLVPVVFLVLPVTVLFALFPGLAQIQAVAP